MPDYDLDSLGKAFMKEKDNMPEDCPMADKIPEYAFGELDSEEERKVREHIKTCRYCLDMYMDIRLAEEDAEKTKDEPVEVLPGLQKAIDKGKEPQVSLMDKIREAMSDFFGQGFGFRPVTALATVALLVFVGIYVFQNITPNDPYAIHLMLQGRTQTGLRGGQPEYKEFQVEPGGVLNSGDYFRFQVKIDADAYVYVVFRDSSGEIQSQEFGFVAEQTDLMLPDETNWFRLDETVGTESLYLLASRKQIDDFDRRIEELKNQGVQSIGKVFPDATIKSFSFEHR